MGIIEEELLESDHPKLHLQAWTGNDEALALTDR
jgi:hypothetical protein